MSKFFDVPVEIVTFDRFSENVPYDMHPGDSIIDPDRGVVRTLVTLVIEDRSHETWEVLITAHEDVSQVGNKEFLGFSTRKPLEGGLVLVRNV